MDNDFTALAKCFACGGDAHILIHRMFRNIQKDHQKVDPRNPFCQQCADMMKAGNTILISVRKGEKGDNPYSTGKLCVMTPKGSSRLFKEKVPPIAFIEDDLWDQLGLPKQDDDHSDPNEAQENWVKATCEKCGTVRGVRPEWRTAKQASVIQARCRTCQPDQHGTEYDLFPHKLDLYATLKEKTENKPHHTPEGETGTQGVSHRSTAESQVVDRGSDPAVGSGEGVVESAR